MSKEIRAFNFEVRAEQNEKHGHFLSGVPIVFSEGTDVPPATFAYGEENVFVVESGLVKTPFAHFSENDYVVYLKQGAYVLAQHAYDIMSEKDEKILSSEKLHAEWNEERAKTILNYYIPRKAEWDNEDKSFYFFDNRIIFGFYIL